MNESNISASHKIRKNLSLSSFPLLHYHGTSFPCGSSRKSFSEEIKKKNMMLLSSVACRNAKSSRLISLGKHFSCNPQLSYFSSSSSSSSSYSSETKFKYFGDERDKIAEILISEGGSKSFILENLRENRRHYTHDPISLQSTVTKKEAPFVSSPLDRQQNERKVSIIGCGTVGLATAYSLLNQELCDTICLVDRDAERLEGEVKDLQQAAAFASRCRIEGSNEYDFIQDSDLIFFTAGVGQKEGESRLDLLGRNASIVKDVMSKIIKHSPNSPVCIVSNPCDVMAAVAAKVAGDQCHPGQIFGSGKMTMYEVILLSMLNIFMLYIPDHD